MPAFPISHFSGCRLIGGHLRSAGSRLAPVLVALLLVSALAGGAFSVRCEAASSVGIGPDARLLYSADSFGNTVPDFSLAGYRNGGVALPSAPVIAELQPAEGTGDDTARIQEALDRVARMPARASDGVRGALLLRRGAYRCEGTLVVAPGVTLRGEGPDAGGSVITATRIPKNASEKPVLIRMRGTVPAPREGRPVGLVRDEKVPIGGRTLHVVGASSALAAGDLVLLERKPNQAWIHALRMDRIEGLRDGGRQWTPAGYRLSWQARVAAVQGDRISLDAPVMTSLERAYDETTVSRLTGEVRGCAAAVESLRLVSVYRQGRENSDEAHAWDAITVDALVDSWVRDVTALHFANSCVKVELRAARITVQDCAMLDPVSEITGGRRYSFSGAGQYVLFQRCYTRNGRHDFVNGHYDVGPTVYLDCLAERTHADIGPHHRWACGQLYDNVKGGQIHVQDRGRSGSGHGWAGNAQVFWNCEGTSIVCQRAWIPSAQNWAIGCIAPKGKPALKGRPDGAWESHGTHVAPRSLYLAQLRARIAAAGGDTSGALLAVTTAEQRSGALWAHLAKKYASDR